MAGDEQRRLRRLGRARERELFHDAAGARQKNIRHARMRPDRTAVKKSLAAALLRPRKIPPAVSAKPQFPRHNLLREIALADEERDNKNTPRKNAPQNLRQIRLLLPKSLLRLREEPAPAQFIDVLIDGRGGVRVHGRSVPGHHQRRV